MSPEEIIDVKNIEFDFYFKKIDVMSPTAIQINLNEVSA
jgi:hypothetical protein